MPNAYTTLWTNDVCRYLRRKGQEGERLVILFGGPHLSLPSFVRAGVEEGDHIYPVRAFRKRLWALGRMEVGRILPYDTVGERTALEDYVRLLRWDGLKAGGVSEVLLGPPGSPLRFDRPLPPDLLTSLTYTSRRGERRLKHVVDGELRHSTGVQGIFRLAPESAAAMEALVAMETSAAMEASVPDRPSLDGVVSGPCEGERSKGKPGETGGNHAKGGQPWAGTVSF
ncbi:hypothetical protein ABVG11_09670 [Streptomyces sp. HD1123-B1]|uniref:hypothetical protein n=1 Tax=Streptomyces huangiella TaxID=3228804 RepID=UPI003D7D5779